MVRQHLFFEVFSNIVFTRKPVVHDCACDAQVLGYRCYGNVAVDGEPAKLNAQHAAIRFGVMPNSFD